MKGGAVPGRLRIRPMREDDIDAVHAIECAATAFPWSRDSFADCVRVGYACRVLERDESVDAFGIVEMRGVASRVLNLGVRRPVQGRGLGRMLLVSLIDLARAGGADTMTLEVRPGNHVARRLYRRLGFHEVGVRPAYYPALGGREDALVLARNLRAPAAADRLGPPECASSPG